MISYKAFKEYLEEGYKNLFTDSQKRKYAEEAYAQLEKSYEKVGGIVGVVSMTSKTSSRISHSGNSDSDQMGN